MPDDISIIGGGPSAGRVDLAALPGTIICVNDAAMHSPRCDIIVSMDRLWLENRWAALEHLELPAFVRLSAMHNMLENLYRPWVHPFERKNELPEFGNHLCTLNGPNSGHCAMNLAFVMRPKRVHLIGFDMGRAKDGAAYWFPSYSWGKPQGSTSDKRYGEWAKAMDSAVAELTAVGIEVVRVQ